MSKAAVLWSGGKDSCLALHTVAESGIEVVCLVTFTPEKPEFLAHPLSFMKTQSKALGIPHVEMVVREPFRKSYEDALRLLRDERGIRTVATGDIGEVDGHPNWIRECGEEAGVEVLTPLWGVDRGVVLERLLAGGIRAVVSCVDRRRLGVDWVGRELDWNAVEDLRRMAAATGLDVCGENGEYHTLVVDGPPFRKSIRIGSYSKRERDSLFYIDIREASLQDKPASGTRPRRKTG